MPKVVDHDQRRMAIAKVVEEIVFEEGVEALTIRGVAKRARCSASVLAHYFDSKLDMLVFTHRRVRSRAETGLRKGMTDGLDAMECFQWLLPLDDARWRDWHICFAFLGLAPTFKQVRSEWSDAIGEANQIMLRVIAQAQAQGTINPARDPQVIADSMQAIVNGIASLVAQAREEWPPDRQIAQFRYLFSAIAA